jgi:hypothetical protein
MLRQGPHFLLSKWMPTVLLIYLYVIHGNKTNPYGLRYKQFDTKPASYARSFKNAENHPAYHSISAQSPNVPVRKAGS